MIIIILIHHPPHEYFHTLGMKTSSQARLEFFYGLVALKMAENCEKLWFTFFCIFSSLYRRFRLSRVSQTIDLEEIYRLVSKILNFTSCDSVFGRFCVLCCKGTQVI